MSDQNTQRISNNVKHFLKAHIGKHGRHMSQVKRFNQAWIPLNVVEAMSSKVILMMPKESSVKQISRSKDSRIKFQDSRIIKIKIQDSRFKKQGKTQSR